MSKIERPGVDQRWMKSWKADRRNGIEWRDQFEPLTRKELEHFVQYGRVTAPFTQAAEVTPPFRSWELDIPNKLSIYGLTRQFEAEVRGMGGEPFDMSLSSRAFAAAYTHEMIELRVSHLGPIRFGEGKGAGVRMTLSFLPFTALGVVIGCKDEAFKLARLQIAAYRRGFYGYNINFYPIFHFILRILADYLEESPITLIGEPLKEPIYNNLYGQWRVPDAAALVDACLAACDEHTRRCREGKDREHEFENRDWTRTPIEILLLFKLRQLLGLPNPVLDHPLMDTPLGKLPEAEIAFSDIANGPDDLIYRVRQRLMQDGYDEDEIVGYYKD